MKLFTTSLYGAAAVALAMAVTPAHAVTITGSNLDFEATPPTALTPNTDQAEGATTGTAAIPGWTINAFAPGAGFAGVWAPKAGGVFFSSPATWELNQVGFLQTNSNISQNLNGTFNGTAGTVQVTLKLGESLVSPLNLADDSITLLANGSAVAGGTELLSAAFGGPNLTAGQFDLNTYDFAISSGLATSLSGDTLGLEISNNTDPGTLYIDNVAIDGGTAVTPSGGSSVPEPASLSILGVALLGYAAWRRSSNGTNRSGMTAAA